MSTFDEALWKKISEFQIDEPGSSLPFSKRLARENKWSNEYTQKVIFEYKRFIYLIAVGKEELTPSDQVDQAWHLHLLYTCSYWHQLCKEVLGFELHHLPTKGGLKEQGRFRSQYEKTLRIYLETFGSEPDPGVWPSVNDRFENVESFVRINDANSWVIKKPSIRSIRLFSALTIPLYVAACTENVQDADIWFWLKAALGAYVVYHVLKWLNNFGGKGGSGGGGCSGCSGCGGCGG